MDEPSTTRLLAQVRGGDEQAFTRLVGRHQGALLRYARGLLGPGGAFEDVVQDAFLKLARRPPRLVADRPEAERGQLDRWLLKVTRNHCMDVLRAERRRRRREEERAVPEATAGGLDLLEAQESRRAVEQRLGRLPESQREVLVLRLLGEHSYREIAELTGKTVGTVGWLISEGMRRLTTELLPRPDAAPEPQMLRREG